MSVSRNNELLRANQSYSTNGFFISCLLPRVHSIPRGFSFYPAAVVRRCPRRSWLPEAVGWPKLSTQADGVIRRRLGDDVRGGRGCPKRSGGRSSKAAKIIHVGGRGYPAAFSQMIMAIETTVATEPMTRIMTLLRLKLRAALPPVVSLAARRAVATGL